MNKVPEHILKQWLEMSDPLQHLPFHGPKPPETQMTATWLTKKKEVAYIKKLNEVCVNIHAYNVCEHTFIQCVPCN